MAGPPVVADLTALDREEDCLGNARGDLVAPVLWNSRELASGALRLLQHSLKAQDPASAASISEVPSPALAVSPPRESNAALLVRLHEPALPDVPPVLFGPCAITDPSAFPCRSGCSSPCLDRRSARASRSFYSLPRSRTGLVSPA